MIMDSRLRRDLLFAIGVIVVFTVSFCALIVALRCDCITSCYYVISAIADAGIFVTSIIALVGAFREYHKHKEEERTRIICEYNHRYTTDKYISKIIRWIIKVAITDDKDGKIIDINLEKCSMKPDINDKEMFMRFFEELNLVIEKKLMRKEDAQRFFAYYAQVFDEFPQLRKDVTDYKSQEEIDELKDKVKYEDYWSYFREFTSRFPKLRQKNNN